MWSIALSGKSETQVAHLSTILSIVRSESCGHKYVLQIPFGFSLKILKSSFRPYYRPFHWLGRLNKLGEIRWYRSVYSEFGQQIANHSYRVGR